MSFKDYIKESNSEKESLSESPLSWKSDARSYLSTISSIEKCFDAAYRDGALSSRDLSDANSSLSDVKEYLRRLS